MGWLALAFLLLVGLAWLAFTLFRGGTIYFYSRAGFTAYSPLNATNKLRPVPPDRFERILQRFVTADLFDSLWVAYHPKGDYGGLVLSIDGDIVTMDVTFRPLKNPDLLPEFRQKMRSWGYNPSMENPWNVGMGEDMESFTMEYRFKRDLDEVREATERALSALEGAVGSEVFVHAWQHQDGPTGIGIRVIPAKDALALVP